MYLFTRRGIFTVVKDRETDLVVIRALTPQDAGRICDLVEELTKARPVIYVGTGSSYLYRIYISPVLFAELMRQLAFELDYPEVGAALSDGSQRDKMLAGVQYLMAYWQAYEAQASDALGSPRLIYTCPVCHETSELPLERAGSESCPACEDKSLSSVFDIWQEGQES